MNINNLSKTTGIICAHAIQIRMCAIHQCVVGGSIEISFITLN